MILSAVVVLSSFAAPQVPPNLRLPEAEARPQPQAQRPVAEIERFRRDLPSLRGSAPEVEHALVKMAQDYPDVEALILQRLPAALARELGELMIASRRFGTPKIADEILFQLLARPVGDATREMLETMVTLKGADARPALRDCIRGRISGVRRIATEILARLGGLEDLEFALELASAQVLDLQLCGIELLAVVPADAARERLVRLLAKEPTIAGAAATQLLRLGDAAVPFLQRLLAEPAIDRSFAYAAFLLAVLDRDGTRLPAPAALPALRRSLEGPDQLGRALAAVAVASLCYHGQAPAEVDRAVVPALLDLVAPTAFVPNFELVRRPAEQALRKLSGRTGTESIGWRNWWADAQANFAGLRARIDLQPADAGAAVVVLRGEQRTLSFVGEQLADLPPAAGAFEYVLDPESMLALVGALRAAGFMRPDGVPVPEGLPLRRSLELIVRGARTAVGAPVQDAPAFDALVAVVEREAEAQMWQLLRHPTDEPERGAFWRAERRFIKSQTDRSVLDRRSVQRAIKLWPLATPQLRSQVLAWWLQLPARRELLTEDDGLAITAILARAAEFGEQELVLLELAALAPGDRVWRDCVDLAARSAGGGRAAVDRVFTVLGADRVLQALADERPPVRRAALDQVVFARDLRAAPRLLAMFDDPEPSVRRAAVFAAGQLQLAEARAPLIDRIVADGTDPLLRRDALVALGRVGGEAAFSVLQRALASPVAEDREAALRGLGELQDERAAQQLAQVFAASLGSPTGEFARTWLMRMGAALAVPALQKQLQAVQNEAVRTEIVLLLGGWLDPSVVPELVDLLQRGRDRIVVSGMLSGTTGLDLDSVADPVLALRNWHREHRLEPQWRWLLQALQRQQLATSLDEAQFAPAAGIVAAPELARLMVEGEPGRIRALAGAVLRTLTRADYGQVTIATPLQVREAIASRYRELYERARAAQNR